MAASRTEQPLLFDHPVMPQTRFQGSKRKLADWILQNLSGLEFDTVLDAFGGTGSISHAFKRAGKSVTYNDRLRFNHLIGLALIENAGRTLSPDEVERVVARDDGRTYDDFIERTFHDIYFTDDENRWLDAAVANIDRLEDPYARAIAFFALFQAALAKRPYNLFHRRNLYMRNADVKRSFGNKKTWDTPFEDHFRKFVAEANQAVFDNGKPCRSTAADCQAIEGAFDLVYIDTPYMNARGVGVSYRDFYHFLEGLTDCAHWSERIDWSSKHLRLTPEPDVWSSPDQVEAAFDALFERFAGSILAVSYRSDGIPSIATLKRSLARHKGRVDVQFHDRYQYALSTNRKSREVLLIGR